MDKKLQRDKQKLMEDLKEKKEQEKEIKKIKEELYRKDEMYDSSVSEIEQIEFSKKKLTQEFTYKESNIEEKLKASEKRFNDLKEELQHTRDQ